MAGTVVLDDIELREAQRDYLDFLDDEVREARGRETLALGAPGDADGPSEAAADAAPRRAGAGPGAPGLLRPGRRPQESSIPDLVTFLAVDCVVGWSPVRAALRERSCNSPKCKWWRGLAKGDGFLSSAHEMAKVPVAFRKSLPAL